MYELFDQLLNALSRNRRESKVAELRDQVAVERCLVAPDSRGLIDLARAGPDDPCLGILDPRLGGFLQAGRVGSAELAFSELFLGSKAPLAGLGQGPEGLSDRLFVTGRVDLGLIGGPTGAGSVEAPNTGRGVAKVDAGLNRPGALRMNTARVSPVWMSGSGWHPFCLAWMAALFKSRSRCLPDGDRGGCPDPRRSDPSRLEESANQGRLPTAVVPGEGFNDAVHEDQALHIFRGAGHRDSDLVDFLGVMLERLQHCVQAESAIIDRGRLPEFFKQGFALHSLFVGVEHASHTSLLSQCLEDQAHVLGV